MRNWRDDFRELAEEIRDEDRPEAVARLFEHVGDLGREPKVQLESGPWLEDLRALDYDELILASVALNRVRETAEDSARESYREALEEIVSTVEGEIHRREQR